MSDLAPIALFVYKRLDHTKKTIETLLGNDLASDSDLYIFSDSAQSDLDRAQVNEVRNYIKNIKGFKSVIVTEASNNMGLAASIVSGVTKLVNEFGKIIVLEDDIITSKYFLSYMNRALSVYMDEKRVMHISGYVFPCDFKIEKDVFFIHPTTCWGWGTWKRAWDFYEKNPEKLTKIFSKKMIKKFNLNSSVDYFSQVILNKKGKLNTWAIFWYASVFGQQGLSLHPTKSLCFNIGIDGSGEHCKEDSSYNVSLANEPVSNFDLNIEESVECRQVIEAFYRKNTKSWIARVKQKIRNFI